MSAGISGFLPIQHCASGNNPTRHHVTLPPLAFAAGFFTPSCASFLAVACGMPADLAILGLCSAARKSLFCLAVQGILLFPYFATVFTANQRAAQRSNAFTASQLVALGRSLPKVGRLIRRSFFHSHYGVELGTRWAN
jgi:hypothetical protein